MPKRTTICQLYAQGSRRPTNTGGWCSAAMKKPVCKSWSAKPRPNPRKQGRRERREHEYIRHGTRVLINSLGRGHRARLAWSIGTTRTATDFVTHLTQAYQLLASYGAL